MTSPRKFVRPFLASLIALAFLQLSGCAALKEGLEKAVLMDYDHAQNFQNYELLPINYVSWGGGASESGIKGGANVSPHVYGFWAVFVVCNLRNEGSQSQPFPFDMKNFFVTFDGKDHPYQPLQKYNFSTYPNGLNATPAITLDVNAKFPDESTLGKETDTFAKNSYQSVLNYRFAIYVTTTTPGVIDFTTPLSLRYKNYPNIMSGRNQPPATKSSPTKQADLPTTCRAQA